MAVAAILNSKNFNFWSRDCNRVQHFYSAPNFIEILYEEAERQDDKGYMTKTANF